MRVLVIGAELDTFVNEQCLALKDYGVQIFKFKVKGHGIKGYLKEFLRLKKEIRELKPDIIHAHYGLSGLLANFQRKIPVVTTYHGSDINSKGWVLYLSKFAMYLSAFNIFVNEKMIEIADYNKKNKTVIPCGIDSKTIKSIPRAEARIKLGIAPQTQFGLFSSSFDNAIKNYPLARDAVKEIKDLELKELKGFSREDVNLMMNACNFLILTSLSEGSPQVIKEAMTCGTPIVSVDVGDVKYVLGDTEGCYIAERNPSDIAKKIVFALSFKGKTNGQQRIIDLGLCNHDIAHRIYDIYLNIKSKKSLK